jgi:hypothetical protein
MRGISASLMALGFVSAFSIAHAEPIGDSTKCSVVEEIMDAASQNMRKVREIEDYISRTMQSIDKSYGARGEPEVLHT